MKLRYSLHNMLRNNKSTLAIIVTQVLVILTLIIPSVNTYFSMKEQEEFYATTPIHSAILYMNHVPYILRYPDSVKSNGEQLMNNQAKVYDFYDEHEDLFAGISPKRMKYIYREAKTDEYYSVLALDPLTLSTIDASMDVLKEAGEDDVLAVMVQASKKAAFPVGTVIEHPIPGLDANFQVRGYYPEGTSFPTVNFVDTAGTVTLKDFFIPYVSEQTQFVLQRPEDMRSFKKDALLPETPDGSILYIHPGKEDEAQEQFGEYVKANGLGYFTSTNELFKKQREALDYIAQTKLDSNIALLLLIVMTVAAIGGANGDRFYSRYHILRLHGATKRDLYMLTFLYYIILILFSLLCYVLFSHLLQNTWIQTVFSWIPLVRFATGNDLRLHLRGFALLSIVFTAVAAVISLYPLYLLGHEGRRK